MSEKFSSGTINPKQTNNQTNNLNNLFYLSIKVDELLTEIGNVLPKKESLICTF